VALLAALASAAVGAGVATAERAAGAALLHWTGVLHANQPLDLSAPRSDGRLTLTADGRLFLLGPHGRLAPFARGPGGYTTQLGTSEPYLTSIPADVRLPAAGCAFARDDLYVLVPTGRLGLIRVTASGQASRFAYLPSGGLPNGITFDQVGSFGHRLLVTEEFGKHASVFAFDCRGHRSVIAPAAPRLEGGIAVAPATFGDFGGTLVAPDEDSGNLIDLTATGRARVIAHSGLPIGGDIGIESLGFVPADQPAGVVYVSDRLTPGNAHPGDNLILALSERALRGAGVRGGDLLAVTEGGALMDDIRCAASCTVRYIAGGPPPAHVEGHVEFSARSVTG
jgi:hypothetical protein